MTNPIRRSLLRGYMPMAAAVLAAALFVAVVPTTARRSPVSPGGIDDLLQGARANGDQPGGGLSGAIEGGAGGTTPGTGGASASGGTVGKTGGPVSAYTPTGTDCSRQKVIQSPTCRPIPAFKGDNGGATYTNVKPDAIQVVVYEPGNNAQVDALLGAFGASSSDDSNNTDALEAYEKYFNANFETYGRHISITFKRGPGNASTPDEQVADAKAIVDEEKASFVISAVGSTYLHDELARRGIPAITGGLSFQESWYEQRAPLIYGLVPDLDTTLDNVAAYWCRRLKGGKAEHSGDPVMQQQTRKLGLIYPNDNQELTGGELLKKKIQACGGTVAKTVTYASDVSTAQQQATNGIAQLKDAGVNVVTCTCDPIAPIFFTNAATSQGYFPEWLANGVLLTDIPDFERLYNQQQMAHNFGVTVFPKYTNVADGAAWKAYFAAKPSGSKDAAIAGGPYFAALFYLFSAVEAAGPNINPRTFAQGLFSIPSIGGETPSSARVSFGPQGPSPFTGIDDVTEFWWDSTRDGPDGKPGYNFYVDAGRRRQATQWPSTKPNVFVDDGSAQPARDPNR